MGMGHAARATALAFVFYLRPSETLALTGKSIVAPVCIRGKMSPWSVLLHPSEDGVQSKVRAVDESLLADS
eukprot:12209176-Karenia_brevis.AAC.1